MFDPFRTTHYEVTPEAEAPAGTDEGAEPAAEEEAWTPPTREEVELMNERLEFFQQQQAQNQQPEAEAEEEDLPELWEMSRAEAEQWVRNQYYAMQQEEQQGEEAQAQMRDIVHDVASRDGEFLNPAVAEERTLIVANSLAPEMYQRYGVTMRAAEAAIAKAASIVREEELVAAKAYHEQQINQVRGLANVRQEPSGQGQGTQNAAPPSGFGEKAVVNAWFLFRDRALGQQQ